MVIVLWKQWCFCSHHRSNPAELTFLTEYVAAMNPAQATNILQVEQNTKMGWQLTNANLLTIKLDGQVISEELQVSHGWSTGNFLSCIYFLFNFFYLTFQWLILWYLNVLSLCVSFALCLSAFHILCFAHFELCCCWNVQIDLPWRWESRTVLVRCHKTPEFVTAVILLPKLRTIWTDIILKSCWNIGLQ